MEKLILILSILIMLIGIAGSFLPVLPGIPLVFLGILGYGWYEGFKHVTVQYLAVIGGLTVLSVLVDYVAGAAGAKKVGSSQAGIIGAVLGAIIGIFWGPLGILIGPLVGAFIGEYIVQKNAERAVKVAGATVVAIFAGIIFKVILGLGMLVSFLIVVF